MLRSLYVGIHGNYGDVVVISQLDDRAYVVGRPDLAPLCGAEEIEAFLSNCAAQQVESGAEARDLRRALREEVCGG